MTTIFVHTALFKAEKGGFNELHMKITVDMASTYTLQFTENGPDYEKEEKSYIHNIHYLPYSFMSMISATGENVFTSPSQLCHRITKICTTLDTEKLEMDNMLKLKIQEKNMLQQKLDAAMIEIDNLYIELSTRQVQINQYKLFIEKNL